MSKLIEERLLKIRILSKAGGKIHIKLPISFVKNMVKNNTFDLLSSSVDMIEGEKIQGLLVKAFDYELTGEIAYMERKNGDIIRLVID